MTSNSPAYQKRWRLDRELGRTRSRDAAPVRAHINVLLASRLSLRAIADLAEVSPSSVHSICTGRQGTVRHDTAKRILAVTVDGVTSRPLRSGFVPAVGARRRIEALLAIAWRHEDITAAMPGVKTSSRLVLHQVGGWVSRDTFDAVAAAYTALSGRPGPSERTRRRATVLRYAPPLAWEDDDIDDPYAAPVPGYENRYDQCSEPGCVGAPLAKGLCSPHYMQTHRGVKPRVAVDLDEWLHLIAGGEGLERAADRCGTTLEGIRAAAVASGRDHVIRTLAEQMFDQAAGGRGAVAAERLVQLTRPAA